jgi:hypothetical protein
LKVPDKYRVRFKWLRHKILWNSICFLSFWLAKLLMVLPSVGIIKSFGVFLKHMFDELTTLSKDF